jgi:hypothetical protein
MNDPFHTRTIITTAVVAAVAALLVGPASALPVDEGPLAGEASVGLTGEESAKVDRAVAAADAAFDALRARTAIEVRQALGQQSSVGLTGDGPRSRGQVLPENAALATGDASDVNWTWVGFGAGMAALLAAAMGALYLSARHRDRVSLP